MTSRKSLIAFPVLETFLKTLLDRKWHNKYLVRNQWKQAIPPEWFARRRQEGSFYKKCRRKVVPCSRSIDGVVSRVFDRAVFNSLQSEYIEIRELGSVQMENYEIRITEKGYLRCTEGIRGFRFVTINGETHSLKAWAKKLDLNYNKFRFWMDEKKLSPEEAAKISKNGVPPVSSRLITYAGETKTLADWCRALGLNRSKMSFYLKSMTFEGAMEKSKEQPKEN